jgi:exonuclease III
MHKLLSVKCMSVYHVYLFENNKLDDRETFHYMLKWSAMFIYTTESLKKRKKTLSCFEFDLKWVEKGMCSFELE